MNLETIAFSNLRRRKGRMAFLVAGLLLGVGTVVTLLSLSSALTAEAQHKLENFGANIIITPRSDNLSLSYGGITLGGVTIDAEMASALDLPVEEGAMVANVVPGGPAIGSLHRRLLPTLGTALGEMFDFEGLRSACLAQNRWTFFFVAAPNKIPGGLGSPGNALALR